MKTDDEKLAKMLKSWGNIEPAPAFESNVWRSIRQTTSAEQRTQGHFLLWAANRPGYLSAAAALIGIAAGLTSALTVQSPSAPLQNNLFRPLPGRSLSTSYVHLIAGEKP